MKLEALSERVKWARQRATPPISQSKLAEVIGVTPATINKLESGSLKSSSKIVELADALKVSVHWLKTGKGNFEQSVTASGFRLKFLDETLTKLGLDDDDISRIEKLALDEAMKILIEKKSL
ncbi:HTH cro/C1-type domain-containing protein [Vibrio chagasii]|nr:HTH cro/C1-type domain-containing protein [Vibrio chagasii]